MGAHEAARGDAAIRVLAEKGSRGFTHRAVDEYAGLPEGTASRYARSRDALLTFAASALFAADIAQATHAGRGRAIRLDAFATGADTDAVADAVVAMVAEALAAATTALLDAPQRYRARVELQLESSRSPALRTHFLIGRAMFVTEVAEALAGLNVESAHAHADVLIAMIDGILHRQLVIGEPALAKKQLGEIFVAYVRSIMKMRDGLGNSSPTKRA